MSQEPKPYKVAGNLALRCVVCENEFFFRRAAQLNTAVATFFELDWMNRSAICLVCDRMKRCAERNRCGYIHWFLPPR